MKSKNLEVYSNVPGFEKAVIGELPDRWANIFGDKTAITDSKGEKSYRELADDCIETERRLRAYGIKKDTIVALQIINRICFAEILFALFRIGAVPVMILPAFREDEIIRIMKKTGAAVYIGPVEYAGFRYEIIGKEIRTQIPGAVTVLVEEECPVPDAGKEEMTSAREGQGPEYDDVALLLLSGGTTGTPKLIPRTHADYIYNAKKTAERACLNTDTVYLAALPIAHNLTLACPGLLGTLCAGGRVVLCCYPSPDEILALIEEEGVTITALVPTVAQLCMDLMDAEEYDISSLEVIITGGARLEQKVASGIREKFDCTIQNQYGTAEGLIMSTSLNDPVEWTLNCQGRPVSEADDIRIVDEEGRELEAGESGELIVKGLYTIESYFREPDQEEKFTRQGYYRTGDRAVITPEGNVRVLGRMQEQINRAGEKILPEEIEKNLLELEEIRQVKVIAVPDPLLGQRSCAFIQFAEGRELSKNEIVRRLNEMGIVQYKIPGQIQKIGKWPVTKIGKIDIQALREMAAGS